MSKKKKSKKKEPIKWTELLFQFIIGLTTGIILLVIERLM